jgi:hypothetical protein
MEAVIRAAPRDVVRTRAPAGLQAAFLPSTGRARCTPCDTFKPVCTPIDLQFVLANRRLRRNVPTKGRKEKHSSRGEAEAHIRALIRLGRHQPEGGRLNVYRCPRCCCWHVGHTKWEE